MKITLLGDSIRQQYEGAVRELLGEEYEVFSPDENCRFSKYTLRGMWDWSEGIKNSRIVHWNNGLWDICDIFNDGRLFTSLDEYVDNMLRIADILLKRCEKVIFATTTPITLANPYTKNSDIEKYNDALVTKLKEKGVIINDLYSLVATDIDRYLSDDNIHLSKEGVLLCAKQVADTILSVEATLKSAEKCDKDDFLLSKSGAPVLI